MSLTRQCTVCGAALSEIHGPSLCAACIFQRLSATGSPAPKLAATQTSLDFHAEYELLGEIGRGGMGVIYKAHQASLNRVVALKVIHGGGHSGESARRRFRSEVEVAARLNHPNIVPIFDTGEIDGLPCFSMEFFPGGTLATRMGEFRARPDVGVRILVKVARAVAFAHQHGVLHRDLKPANILLDDAGEPHVGDFGLAKEMNSSSDLTQSGAVLGSPNYMSPEQAAGRSAALTVAADIYSLGVILYQMIAGRTPFSADTPLETLRLVVESEPQPPSSILARADRDLETICLKCLIKEPEGRYRTADDLADDLDRWLRHEPIRARPGSGIERLFKWGRRHPALASLTSAFLLALLGGTAGIFWQWRQTEDARRSEMQQRRLAEAALARAAMSLAEVSLREGNGPATRAVLETVPRPLRDATWNYLLGESDTSRPVAVTGLHQVDALAANPAAASIFAGADRSGRIVIFDSRDGRPLRSFKAGFETNGTNATLRIAFSPDGQRIAVGRTKPGGIVLHSTVDGSKLSEWAAPATGQMRFHPDGTTLLQTSADRRSVQLWDTASGKARWTHLEGYHSAALGSDPSHVIEYSWNSQLRVVSAEDGKTLAKLPGEYFEVFTAQPGDSLLVAANPLGFIRGYDQGSGAMRFEFQPHESPIRHIAFLPGAERFLTAATLTDGRQALDFWESRNGRQCHTLTGGRGEIRDLALHPISGELLIAGEEIRAWQAATLSPWLTLRSSNAHPSALFWGTDDELFAPLPGGVHGSHLLQLSGESPQVLWRSDDSSQGQPSRSADGRRVAFGRYNANSPIVVLERDGSAVRERARVKPGFGIAYVRIDASGERIAVARLDYGRVRVLDVATGKQALSLSAKEVNRFSDLVWLAAGSRLAGLVTAYAPRSAPGSLEQIILWDAKTGAQLATATNDAIATVACAAPDGLRFAEAGADRKVRIRDGSTLAVQSEFRVHNAPITALAWHPTRPILATASEDLVIRLWNLETGARLEELRGPQSPPSVLSFSPGGTRLATAARDGVVRIWEPRSVATPAVTRTVSSP